MKIVSIGEITIDRYLRQNKTFVGGISLNFAVNAKQAGAENCALISCVGSGPLGQWVLEALDREGVDRSHVMVMDGETAECDILVHSNADREFPGYRVNALSQLRMTDKNKAFVQQHDVAVSMFDVNLPNSILTELLSMNTDRLKIVVDFGDWSNGRRKELPPDLFKRIDLAFFSGDEATQQFLDPIAKNESCRFVLTLGAAGSLAYTDGGWLRQPALEVDNPVDSTGCGDAFQGAFTVSYFQEKDVSEALFAGATQAAKVLQHYGAFSQ